MTEEIDKRTFLQLLGVGGVSALAACSSVADPETGEVVPDGEPVGAAPGGAAMADEFEGSILRLEEGESFDDVEPDTEYAWVFATDMSDYRVWRP